MKRTLLFLLAVVLCACSPKHVPIATIENQNIQTRDGLKAQLSEDFIYIGDGVAVFPTNFNGSRFFDHYGQYYLFVKPGENTLQTELVSFLLMSGGSSSRYMTWTYTVGGEDYTLGDLSYKVQAGFFDTAADPNFHNYVLAASNKGYCVTTSDYFCLSYTRSYSGIRRIDYWVRKDSIPAGLTSKEALMEYMHNRFSEAVEIK